MSKLSIGIVVELLAKMSRCQKKSCSAKFNTQARISSKGFHPPSLGGEVFRGWNGGGLGSI